MPTSGFPIITKVTNASYASGDILPSDLDFSANTSTNDKLGTPPNLMREIQVQFTTNVTGDLTITYDGTTFFPVNNGTDIIGTSTFTFFVDSTTLLNFEFSIAASIIITVGG